MQLGEEKFCKIFPPQTPPFKTLDYIFHFKNFSIEKKSENLLIIKKK
jgi:hypothetical protein